MGFSKRQSGVGSTTRYDISRYSHDIRANTPTKCTTDLSTSLLESALRPLAQHLDCDLCMLTLEERIKTLVIEWASVKVEMRHSSVFLCDGLKYVLCRGRCNVSIFISAVLLVFRARKNIRMPHTRTTLELFRFVLCIHAFFTDIAIPSCHCICTTYFPASLSKHAFDSVCIDL